MATNSHHQLPQSSTSLADSPIKTPHIRHLNNHPTPANKTIVSSQEELLVECLKAEYELEVYKGKLEDVQDDVDVIQHHSSQPQLDGNKNTINLDFQNELWIYAEKIEALEAERDDKIRIIERISASVDTVKQCLSRVFQRLNDDDDNVDIADFSKMASALSLIQRVEGVVELTQEVEIKVGEYQETRKKERRQLESSVVSLTEENRDINTLLRVALVEKENVEKSLNRLKGNTEQKRVPLLQFAERGLYKVGFSFMMASQQNDQLTEGSSASNASSKSDGSDYEEEVVSLVCM